MAKSIIRVTLFKIPSVEDQKKIVTYYQAMPKKALKVRRNAKLRGNRLTIAQDGKPYIRSVKAGPCKEDQRSQGFTFSAISTFDSVEDMAYYDNGCAAHAELRTFVRSVHQGMMMVYFENEVEE